MICHGLLRAGLIGPAPPHHDIYLGNSSDPYDDIGSPLLSDNRLAHDLERANASELQVAGQEMQRLPFRSITLS